jgi:mono/diheme cytochrome c family protein
MGEDMIKARNGFVWRILSTFVLALALVTAGGLSSVAAQGEVDDPAEVEAGMAVFETNCSGCHGVGGTGSNTGRSLIGVASQEPDRSVHISSVTNGKGTGMPAWGERLSEDEISAAVSYVRLTFVAQAEAELAVTGYNSYGLALIGSTIAFAGVVLLSVSRRRQLAR